MATYQFEDISYILMGSPNAPTVRQTGDKTFIITNDEVYADLLTRNLSFTVTSFNNENYVSKDRIHYVNFNDINDAMIFKLSCHSLK